MAPLARTHLATVVVLVTLACLLLHTHALDCRKFVFAPPCRGIIAKRMVNEKRTPASPSVESGSSQWNSQYRTPTQSQDEEGNFLLAQNYDDVMEPRLREDMVVVRAGQDVVQVPAYVFGVIERSLQGHTRK